MARFPYTVLSYTGASRNKADTKNGTQGPALYYRHTHKVALTWQHVQVVSHPVVAGSHPYMLY